MASSVLFLITLTALSLLAAVSGGYVGPRVGGRTAVPDVRSNQEVQDLGRYSVEEYNRMQRRQRGSGGGRGGDNGEIVFGEVVGAERQVVAGIKYYLKIEGMQRGARKVFESVVVVRPWVRSKELVTFGPSRGGDGGSSKSGLSGF
ncbi:cysteine proteinase inhibitor B [Eucalyptus grandis]|uniref:cysteine proteinase inhibitor B n=1 Tax=Eucalyptus grandis TaxID=71139 RepID=UPI00192E8A0F|nr:cysteine proteinase inhibitor B [Eucalyptus grandis]